MSGPRAPTERPRRDEIAAAVAAYDQANPQTPLPRKRDIEAAVAALTSLDRAAVAARLLIAMFPEGNVCRRSRAALSAATGVEEHILRVLLPRLIDVGILSWERGSRGIASTYRLHLPPRREP